MNNCQFRSNVYMDNQAAGPVITLSTPLVVPLNHPTFNPEEKKDEYGRIIPKKGGRRTNQMGGVAGVDVNIKVHPSNPLLLSLFILLRKEVRRV